MVSVEPAWLSTRNSPKYSLEAPQGRPVLEEQEDAHISVLHGKFIKGDTRAQQRYLQLRYSGVNLRCFSLTGPSPLLVI